MGRSTPSCGCGLFWRGRRAMPRLTRTCGTASATWRNRLASRGISRGPRRCHDAGHRGRAARCVLKQTTYESLKSQSQLGTTNQRREDRGCVAFGGAVPRHSRTFTRESAGIPVQAKTDYKIRYGRWEAFWPCFGEQTATGLGSSAYTRRTALLTKRSAVRSTNHLVTKRA
jgi:hypothetical protein